jgi:hypothetical protein
MESRNERPRRKCEKLIITAGGNKLFIVILVTTSNQHLGKCSKIGRTDLIFDLLL